MHQHSTRRLWMHPGHVRAYLDYLSALADELDQAAMQFEQQLAAAACGDPRGYLDNGVSSGYESVRTSHVVAGEWRDLTRRASTTVVLFECADRLPTIAALLGGKAAGAAALAGALAGAQAQTTTAASPPVPVPTPGPVPAPKDILHPPPPPPPPPKPATGDGSGPFGSKSPSLIDRFWHLELYDLSLAAEIKGLVDAARHMRHYADASGTPLEVDPERMLRDMPRFQTVAQNELDRFTNSVIADLSQSYDGKPLKKTYSGVDLNNGWSNFYAYKEHDSQNWFYAMGGFSYTYTAEAQMIPPTYPGGKPTVRMTYQMHVFDRYNWDEDKKVTIEIPGKKIEITDKDMGRFHEVGLAQEYDMHGSTGSVTIEFPLEPGSPASSEHDLPQARGYEDGRIDPVRPSN